MNAAPRKEAKVPKELTPPDTPVSMVLLVIIEIGFFLLRTPISEAQVSAFASPKAAAQPTKKSGLLK